MRKILNIEYGAVHATYWMTYAIIGSFASAFLLGRGYSNSEIGVILAVGSVAAVFLQPVLADIADRSKKISLIGLTQIVTVGMMVFTALSFIIQRATIALSVVFVMLVAWDTALQPLFNSLAFKLEESGHKIKFGINRAMGSLSYSILCSFLGALTEKAGTQILPVTSEVVLIMMFITLWIVKKHFRRACAVREVEQTAVGLQKGEMAEEDSKESLSSADAAEDINFGRFIKRNKLFVAVSIGVVGLFFSNSVFNNFMLQIVQNVGGDGGDMGRILSLMAMLEIPFRHHTQQDILQNAPENRGGKLFYEDIMRLHSRQCYYGLHSPAVSACGLRNISAGDGMFHRRDNGQRRGSKGPVSLYDNDYCGNYICHSHRRKNTGRRRRE